jgi:hypothetical protein
MTEGQKQQGPVFTKKDDPDGWILYIILSVIFASSALGGVFLHTYFLR